MGENSIYEKRGVSASKSEVHAAIKGLDKGLFPNAFCKILHDHVGNDFDWCNIMHADTAGTKTSLAYMYWKETHDINVWKGIAQDAIVMNIDDMACCGLDNDIILSSTIGRNKHLITGEVISELINSTVDFVNKLKEFGVEIHLAGGETADVGDIVRTIDVGITAFGRLKKEDVVNIDIKAGDWIVGLASYGQSTYENAYNSGIGSNGLTSARHDVLNKAYAELYPESYDTNTSAEVVYMGNYSFSDEIIIKNEKVTIGQLLLSPTRTYLPVLTKFFRTHRKKINGIIHCTGGGQTKVLKFIQNKRVVKNRMLPVPPIFKIIQNSLDTDWKEMYQVFNMGHRLEVYLSNKSDAQHLINLAKSFNIDAQIIGHVESFKGEEVLIDSPYGVFRY